MAREINWKEVEKSINDAFDRLMNMKTVPAKGGFICQKEIKKK
jgi:hypothetical protein